ncbi:hypothetical protein BDY21DRAFT_342290 [Lineolata rhizophorae]|uniref:Uncharacterized protein n=1 Tax=Lineolata rhizophorae TaxID=578093 RepID=A0A6A6P3N0_9PEZI|nr:hypothetical protein BDY21DRAFT_342290 [Lineolata rhizophorae]
MGLRRSHVCVYICMCVCMRDVHGARTPLHAKKRSNAVVVPRRLPFRFNPSNPPAALSLSCPAAYTGHGSTLSRKSSRQVASCKALLACSSSARIRVRQSGAHITVQHVT